MITCLGQIVADIVTKPVEAFPERGVANRVDTISLHTGGCGLNTATVLRRLGMETAVIGAVGTDIFADFLLKSIRQRGINSKGIAANAGTPTSSVIVMISRSGERSFLYCPGSTEALSIGDIDFDIVARSKILHLGGVMKLESLDLPATLRKAKELGVTVSVDTDWDTRDRWLEWLEPCLRYTDIFLPSLDEARMLTGKQEPGEIADLFLDYGIGIVAIKMGDQGCYIRTRDVRLAIPAYKVQMVDASGAGDAFVAGFLAGCSKGRDLETTGKLANACGALCVTEIGTSEGIKSLDAALAFMRNSSPTYAAT